MKNAKRILLTLWLLSTLLGTLFSQISVSFENRNGYAYAVLTNTSSYTANIAWRCINYQKGQYHDGAVSLLPGYEACVGPNYGWTWEPGEEFIYQVYGNAPQNISFRGKTHGDCTPPSSSSDGYIYQGQSIKYNGHYYKLYKKRGNNYIFDCADGWRRL